MATVEATEEAVSVVVPTFCLGRNLVIILLTFAGDHFLTANCTPLHFTNQKIFRRDIYTYLIERRSAPGLEL